MANSNMANNGTFEIDSGWYNRINADYSTQNTHSGNRCMQANIIDGQYAKFDQFIHVVPGGEYKIRLWAKWEHARQFQITVQHLRCEVPSRTYVRSNTDDNMTSTSYQFFEFTHTVPSNASDQINLIIYAQCYNSPDNDNSGTYWFDDIEFYGPTPSKEYQFHARETFNVRRIQGNTIIGQMPTNRYFYAKYENGDRLLLNWPTEGRPACYINLDTTYVAGAAFDDQYTLAERVKLIAMLEQNRTREDFGSGTISGPWCQTFVNWVSCFAYAPDHPIYHESGCTSQVTSLLGSRFHPVGSEGYNPQPGDWLYYHDDDEEDPNVVASHVGLIIRNHNNGFGNTIEANRATNDNGDSIVRQFPVSFTAPYGNSSLRPIGYATPPYKDE